MNENNPNQGPYNQGQPFSQQPQQYNQYGQQQYNQYGQPQYNQNGQPQQPYGPNNGNCPQEECKRTLCGIMALLLGTLGIQYFVINKVGGGFLCILLSLVTCGGWGLISFIQGIMMLTMSDEEFMRKFQCNDKTFPIF